MIEVGRTRFNLFAVGWFIAWLWAREPYMLGHWNPWNVSLLVITAVGLLSR